MKYKVNFYQCGVDGIEPEMYSSISKARKAAADFAKSFSQYKGLRKSGSIYKNNLCRILDPQGLTEAQVSVSKLNK